MWRWSPNNRRSWCSPRLITTTGRPRWTASRCRCSAQTTPSRPSPSRPAGTACAWNMKTARLNSGRPFPFSCGSTASFVYASCANGPGPLARNFGNRTRRYDNYKSSSRHPSRFAGSNGAETMVKTKRIGILTAGGDSPGLNAAIRGVGKTAVGFYGMEIIGFRDGFRGLVTDRRIRLDKTTLSGILTVGGTILGTSRDKPHRMKIDGRTRDMTDVIVNNYGKYGLDALVCLGGGGTQKNALRLSEAGLNIISLPKTIDNDVAMTDSSIGFATALDIATETIDRLHSTAHSHHRIVVAEIMGHRAGWLA